MERLLVNFATSAAGGLRVELQEADSTPIPGFTLADGPAPHVCQMLEILSPAVSSRCTSSLRMANRILPGPPIGR